MERAITLNQRGPITPADLPRKIFKPLAEVSPVAPADGIASLFVGLPSAEEVQRRYLLHVLDATGGNRKRAAEILGINRKTLYRIAARFEIDLAGGAEKISSE
jgi:DNA-binding NtrC family response regulator